MVLMVRYLIEAEDVAPSHESVRAVQASAAIWVIASMHFCGLAEGSGAGGQRAPPAQSMVSDKA